MPFLVDPKTAQSSPAQQGRDDIGVGGFHLQDFGARPFARHDPHAAARYAERISKRPDGCDVRLAVNGPCSDSNDEDWRFRIARICRPPWSLELPETPERLCASTYGQSDEDEVLSSWHGTRR